MAVTYRELAGSCAKLDARNPDKYRFDLESDIAWDQLGASGDYCSPKLMATLGIDPVELGRHLQAYDLFQWAYALNVCEQFIVLEDIIVRFLDQERALLGPTKSAIWLGEEELKHIALFRRYADHLRRVEPFSGAGEAFDAAFAESASALATALDRQDYPSDATYHYVFWLKVLFFEEYTVFIDQRLQAEAELVQPGWLSAHAAHRREEEQHIVTDVAHVKSLVLSETERKDWSKLFVMDFESNARHFLSLETPWRMLSARHPEVVAQVTRTRFVDSGVYDALMSSKTFRRTRAAAPYLYARAAQGVAASKPRRKVATPKRGNVAARTTTWREALRRGASRVSERLGEARAGKQDGTIDRYVLKARKGAAESGRQPEPEPQPEPQPRSNDHDRSIRLVRAIWADVLDLPPDAVDIDANFLTMGGDSVRAVEIHGRIETRYGHFLDFEILRTCRTVREFATYLDRHVGRLPDTALVAPSAAEVEPGPRQSPHAPSAADIAVIGMTCRFPNAPNLDAFWRLLESGSSAFRPVPKNRWNADDYYDERPGTPGKVACKVGAFLDDVDTFDPEAFGLSESHAMDMDPQQRIFLELAANVLDRAGRPTDNIGVFASTGWNTYLPKYDAKQIGTLTAVGNLHNMVAARVSQVLGLRGPAFTVDAACASSLVGVHLACRSLRGGECDMAIAGGVELLFNPQTFLAFGQARVLSSKGACLPFSQNASGFLLGEGGGVVLLRPVADAIAAGDNIIAVIKGSALNNDGGGYSAMSPSPDGQMDVLRRAYQDAGVSPGSVSLVEAHGTATPVGDAVELRALAQVFGDAKGESCGVGSVKSNVGHLFSAAGIASLIKVLLCFERGTLAPIANFDRAHERHHFDRTRFFPIERAQPWVAPAGEPRRAGVTSLGVGGTNCHVVLEQAPVAQVHDLRAREAELIQLCAPDDSALEAVAGDLDEWLGANPAASLSDVSAGINRRSHRFQTRCGLVATSVADLRAQLTRAPRGRTSRVRPKLMFVFSAPGSQYLGMGKHLYEGEPVFRDAFSACDVLLRGTFSRSLTEMLYAESTDSSEIDQIAVTQPLIFAFSYSLYRWLDTLGIRPDGVIGHSAGEYAAACAAGVFDLQTGLRLVTRRGRLIADCEVGGMCAVFSSPDTLQPLLAQHAGELSIAAVNNPNQLVVSGRVPAIHAVAEALQGQGIQTKDLAISCAAHSPLMEPARDGLEDAFNHARFGELRVPFYSTLTGGRVGPGELAHTSYWLDHLTSTVRFEDAIRTAAADGYNVFLELGPSSGLSHSIQLTFPERDSQVVPIPTNSRSEPGWAPTLRGLAALYEAGAMLDTAPLARAASRPALPPYPYHKRRFWAVGDVPLHASRPAKPSMDNVRALSSTEDRSLHDHVIWNRPIAPGAFLIEQCLSGAREHGHAGAALSRVLISRSLDADAFAGQTRLRFTEHVDAPMVVLESRDAQSGGWAEHIQAVIAPPEESRPEPIDIDDVRAQCSEAIDIDTMYQVFENDSFRLGPTVKTATEVQRGSSEVFSRLESPAGVQPSTRFAGLVDGAFHSLAALVVGEEIGSFAFLSFSVERVDLYAELPEVCYAHVQLLGEPDFDAASLRCDVHVIDGGGTVLLRLQHVGLRRAAIPAAASEQPVADAGEPAPVSVEHHIDTYAVAWENAAALAEAPDPADRYILMTRDGALSPLLSSLRRRLEDIGLTVQVTRIPIDLDTFPRRLQRLRPADSAILVVDPRTDQLRALVQGLLQRDRPSCQQLTLIGSNRMNAGFMQSVMREGPGWPCRAILLDVDAPTGNPVHLAKMLVTEIRGLPEKFTVSYDSGVRAVPRLEPAGRAEQALRADGFYWITGGLGGIGRALARDLASRTRAHLLVTGRGDVGATELEDEVVSLGGELLYARADVTNSSELEDALAAASQRWGRLNGVFHLAGVVQDKMVWSQTIEGAETLLAPKVAGTQALLSTLRDRDLDFVALFSSYVSQFGRAGQSDYAAANAFLDQLAWDETGLPVVSLNWFPWSIGMAGSEAYQKAARSQGLIPLHPASAFDAMFGVLAAGHRQVLMAATQPDTRSSIHDQFQAVSWERAEPAAARAASKVRVQAPGRVSTGAGDIEQFLREQLSVQLKVAPEAVDINEPFPMMGLESLTAVNLIREIEDRYELALYPTLLFEITTVAELTRYLAGRLAAGE